MKTPTAACRETNYSPLSKTVLTKDDVNCFVIGLAPGEEISSPEGHVTREQVLYLIEGSVVVRIGDLNYLLNKEDALHIAADKAHVIAAHSSGWAKLLRVEFTPRKIVSHPIYTFQT